MQFAHTALCMVASLVLTALPISGQVFAAREDLRIGSLDDPEYALSSVKALAVDSAGRIYVGQPMDNDIRVYDAQGDHLRDIGRSGRGPGEFQGIRRLEFVDDRLLVVDGRLLRLTSFTEDGDLEDVETLSFPPGSAGGFGIGPHARISGGYVLHTMPSGTLLEADRATDVPLYFLADGDNEPVAVASVDYRRWIVRMELRRGNLNLEHPDPAYSLVEPRQDGDGFYIVDRQPPQTRVDFSEFRVRWFDGRASLSLERHFRYSPREYPESARDSLYAYVADILVQVGLPPARALRMAQDSFPIPEYQAPVSAAIPGNELLWLRRERFGSGLARWIAIDEEGNLAGQMFTPRDVEVLYIREPFVYGVVTGEWDVPYVVRLRMLPTDRTRPN